MALRTLIDVFEERVAESGDGTALRFRTDSGWSRMTWSEWLRESNVHAAALVALGVAPGDRVALVSRTRPEWVTLDQAILAAGAVTVPIFPSVLPRQLALILADAGATVAIVEDPIALEKLLGVRGELPSLRHVVCLDRTATLTHPDARGRSVVGLADIDLSGAPEGWRFDLAALRERGAAALRENPNVTLERRRRVAADDLGSIVYTPGTTGRPRGVELTHRNFVAQIQDNRRAFVVGRADNQLLFLPLAQQFARAMYLTSVHAGTAITFAQRASTVLRDMQETQPTFVAGVPSLYEEVSRRVVGAAGRERGGSRAVRKALALASARAAAIEQRGSLPALEALQFAIADALLFRHVRRLFGGRLRFAICGGAPVAREIVELFVASGVPLLEGYGLTETAGAATANRVDDFRIGTVGRPLGETEIRIDADGEILVRGPTVMRGYHNDPEATAIAFRDGWLCTGDIGEVDDSFVRVTDRKKDMIILSSGRAVAPQAVEALLQRNELVDRAVVYGDRRPFLAALLTLRREPLARFAQEHGVSAPTHAELCQHARVFEQVRAIVDEANRDLPRSDQVRRFAVLDDDFQPQTGELTPTLKMRRKFVTEKYRDILDAFYDPDLSEA